MKVMLLVMVVLATTLLSGCDGTGGFIAFTSCQNDMDNVTAEYGTPEEIEQYDSENYHSHTYWYWCSGFAIVFTWGESVNEGCCQDKNTFVPVCQ
jgi:hypothetical protein